MPFTTQQGPAAQALCRARSPAARCVGSAAVDPGFFSPFLLLRSSRCVSPFDSFFRYLPREFSLFGSMRNQQLSFDRFWQEKVGPNCAGLAYIVALSLDRPKGHNAENKRLSSSKLCAPHPFLPLPFTCRRTACRWPVSTAYLSRSGLPVPCFSR